MTIDVGAAIGRLLRRCVRLALWLVAGVALPATQVSPDGLHGRVLELLKA